MTHRQVITSLITLIALLKGKVALNICMKASFSFILAKLTLKDKRNKKLDPFKFILTLPGCSVSHMRKLFHIYISSYIYISLSHQRGIRASVRVHVCYGPGGPWSGGVALSTSVRATGAVRWSCGVRMMCWNLLNPLLQLQHLPAHGDQSEQRTRSRDESAHSVIFSGNPGGGLGTKAKPQHPRNTPVASTLSILPTTSWLWYVRPLRGGTVSPAHTSTPHLNASNHLDHDRKMTEGLISWEQFTYIHWKALCQFFHYPLDKLGYSHVGLWGLDFSFCSAECLSPIFFFLWSMFALRCRTTEAFQCEITGILR